jgi:hypothetical protein
MKMLQAYKTRKEKRLGFLLLRPSSCRRMWFFEFERGERGNALTPRLPHLKKTRKKTVCVVITIKQMNMDHPSSSFKFMDMHSKIIIMILSILFEYYDSDHNKLGKVWKSGVFQEVMISSARWFLPTKDRRRFSIEFIQFIHLKRKKGKTRLIIIIILKYVITTTTAQLLRYACCTARSREK